MKYLKILPALLFSLFMTQLSFSQSIDDVINKHVEAVGGIDKINAVKSVRITGRFSSEGVEIPTIIIRKGDKIRMDLTIGDRRLVMAYDGAEGWMTNPFGEKDTPENMNAEDIKDLKETGEWEGRLVNYKAKGSRVELLNNDSGETDYKIKIITKDNDTDIYFLDASTYLLKKEQSNLTIMEKQVIKELTPGDYKKISGVMFAMSSETKTSGTNEIQKGKFDKIEVNVKIDDSQFKIPPKK